MKYQEHNKGCLGACYPLFSSIVITIGILFITFIVVCIVSLFGHHGKSYIPAIITAIGCIIALIWFFFTFLRPLYFMFRGSSLGSSIVGLFRKNDVFKGKPYGISFCTSEKRYINLPNPFRGIFVMGGAGSGKSESVAVPAINAFCQMGFTGLVYDFKFPTLGNDVNSYVKAYQRGVSHYWLDFEHPENSYRVNPLNPDYLIDSSYANEFSQAIIENLINTEGGKSDFWTTSAISLLTACVWYLRKHTPQICDLPHAFALVCSDDRAMLELLHTDTETANMTISIYNAMQRKADSQVAGVVSTLQNAISRINTPRLMYVFGANDFSLDLNNSEHPTILTLGNSPTLTKTFAPLCALVSSVCIKLMNRQDKLPSFVLLDEAPTLKIPNFSMLPATGRSNKVATIYMCQDYSQLENQYGKAGAAEIFANLNNHFYGRVSSGMTAEMLSKQFGKCDQVYTSTSSSNLDLIKESHSEGLREVDVVRSNFFTSLGVGEFAGLAVETDTPIWHAQLCQAQRVPTEPCTKANNKHIDYDSYFERVKADIDMLLGNGEAGASINEQAGKKDAGMEMDSYIFQ